MRRREEVVGVVEVPSEYQAGAEEQVLLLGPRSYAQTLACRSCYQAEE